MNNEEDGVINGSVKRWGVACVVVLSAGFGSLTIFGGEATTSPATQPSTQSATTLPAAQAAHWDGVFDNLASDNFGDREKAQKEIEKLTVKDHDLLFALRDRATDDEVKSRIIKRIDEIDDDLAVNPLPISLHLKDALPSDVLAALKEATKVNIQQWGGGNNNQSVTLNAVDEPFWNVIQDIGKQVSVRVEGWQGLQIGFGMQPGMKRILISGPMALVPWSVSRSAQLDLQQDQKPQPEMVNISYTLMMDPRVNVASTQGPQMTHIVDENGTVLYDMPDQNKMNGQRFFFGGGQRSVYQTSTSFPATAKMGKMIASAKGVMDFVVIVHETMMRVDDVDKKVKGPSIPIFGQKLKIDKWEVKDRMINFQIMTDGGNVAMRRGEQPTPSSISFVDANGKSIWNTQFMGGCGGSVGGEFTAPVHIEISQPTRTKTMSVPFELKDIPIP